MGITPSDGFNDQLKRTVREMISRERSNVGHTGRWHKKGGKGGGGDHMAFDITDVNCEPGTVSTDDASIIRFTGSGKPPGIDPDTDTYIIQDVLGLMSSMTDEQLLAARGVAVYWNDYPARNGHWDLLLLTWAGGCGQ